MNGSRVSALETKTIDVTQAPAIAVENHAGNVELESGADGAIHIHAQKYARTQSEAEAMSFQVEEKDNTVRIAYFRPQGNPDHEHIDFKIIAPRNSSLQVTTGGGNVDVSGFSKGLTARSGGGNMRADNVAGAVQVTTGGGNIECGGVNGTLDLTTGGGNIQATGEIFGSAALKTGAGNISAQSIAGSVSAQTGSGNVSVGGRLSGNSELSTGAGNVRAVIPPDSALSVQAATNMGHITDDFGLNASSMSASGSGLLNGQIGNGSNTLKINTGLGNVSIAKG